VCPRPAGQSSKSHYFRTGRRSEARARAGVRAVPEEHVKQLAGPRYGAIEQGMRAGVLWYRQTSHASKLEAAGH